MQGFLKVGDMSLRAWMHPPSSERSNPPLRQGGLRQSAIASGRKKPGISGIQAHPPAPRNDKAMDFKKALRAIAYGLRVRVKRVHTPTHPFFGPLSTHGLSSSKPKSSGVMNRHCLVSIRRKSVGYSTRERAGSTHLKCTHMIWNSSA